MKSWKTTSGGIALIAGAVIGLYFASKNGQLNEASITAAVTSILGGIGLLFAKDNNVTGGTTPQ